MTTHFVRRTLLFILFVSLSDYGFGQKIAPSIIEESSNQSKQIEEDASSSNNEALGTQTTNGSNERGGFVVSAYLGTAKTASTNLKISQPAFNTDLIFENVRLRSRSFDSPQYYGLRAGYFFPQIPFIGVEAEFIHLKVYSDPQQRVRVAGMRRGTAINREVALGEIVQQYSISHGANFLLFNVAARRGFFSAKNTKRNRLILTARAGVGPTIPHTESSIEGQRQEQYELGRFGWQVAGAMEVKLWRGFYGLGEYKYTQTRQRGKIVGGEAESFLRTHHGVFGLSYHF
jgi:hypothetical protein